jgi:Ca-activated chloride channel family protein
MRKILFILSLIFPFFTFAQDAFQKAMEAGNRFYKEQRFLEAADEYTKALQASPGSKDAKFNQANALYMQDKKVDAVQIYAELAALGAADKALASRSWYNKGVVLTDQKNLEESIESYKNALRNEPNDKEARENLQKALLELKKKKEEKKKEEEQDKKQQQQKKQSPPKMQPKEAEQRLRLLQQKEKEVQQRVQKQKSKSGGILNKDW